MGLFHYTELLVRALRNVHEGISVLSLLNVSALSDAIVTVFSKCVIFIHQC